MTFAARFLRRFAILAVVLLVTGGDAFARGRSGHGGRAPRSASVHKELTRTGPGGQERAVTRDHSWESREGRAVRRTTTTGPDGRSRSREVVTERTEDGFERNTTFTGPKGQTASREMRVSHDREQGALTKDVTWTGPRGQTRTQHSETVRTDDGFSRTMTITRPDGGTVTVEKTVMRSTGDEEDAEDAE